ncbi:MAG TPA: class I SAM-dependent methyltransferase [Puia sp.]|uniref:class I SAM-dependent methyltransferase n=1 Tax=Puia sp. TaxID=2045100 RepID=UPI002B86B33C|nr:class I SAM-dependent methyltransferase [Puia sp.]HVU94316.1 class I SAM-dependent methyltransferase [Puia sp.]
MPSSAVPFEPGIDRWFQSDQQLHHLYPKAIQTLAERHWSPIDVSKLALEFLVPSPGSKILDIGSGVGKFVLTAAHFRPDALFFGVEQRRHLVAHAETARNILGLTNAHFFHRNFAHLHFKAFDHFYFYNSFYENLLDTGRIDESIACSPNLYSHYHRILRRKLNEMPVGTRVATFHCLEGVMPRGYQLIEEHIGSLLRFWMKI